MEEEDIPEENPKVRIKPNLNKLFASDAKNFSFRPASKKEEEPIQSQAKEWNQIAFEYLSNDRDIEPLGPTESFSFIDTRKAEVFVSGNGAPNWGEIRRVALNEAKDKRRRCKK